MFPKGMSGHTSPLLCLEDKAHAHEQVLQSSLWWYLSSSLPPLSWHLDLVLCFLHPCIPAFRSHPVWPSLPPLDPGTSYFFSQWISSQLSGLSSDVILSEEPCLCPPPCNKCTRVGSPLLSVSWSLLHCNGVVSLASSILHCAVSSQLTTVANARLNVWHTADAQCSCQLNEWMNGWIINSMTWSIKLY